MKTKNKKQEQKIKPSIILLAVFGIVLVFFLNHWRGEIRKIPEREDIFEMQEIQELREIKWPEMRELEILRELKEREIPTEMGDLKKLKDLLPEEFKRMLEEPKNIPVQEMIFQEFISPDGDMKVKYPEHWFKTEEYMAEKLITVPRHIRERYDFTTLLLAQSIEAHNPLTLIVNKFVAETPLNFDNIIRIIEEINAAQGAEVNILSSEIKENQIIFEAIYQRGNKQFRSKEKTLFLEQGQKVFLITFLSPEEIWAEIQELGNKIIDSTQIIQ